MKTPPPDPDDRARAADAAFYRSLVELGERTSALQSPHRRRHRLVRVVVLTLLAILALVSAAVATKVFLAHDDPVKTDRDPGENIAQAPADRRFGAARAKDPHNSTLWGVRLYYNDSGETCALVGAVDHGRLGQIQNGKFRPLPQRASGECHNMADHIFVARRTYTDTPEPRTILYGQADRTITALQLQTHDGKHRNIPIAPDGSYILPLTGTNPLNNATLTTQTPQHTTTHKLKTNPPPPTLNP
jgi:hypothetical protein